MDDLLKRLPSEEDAVTMRSGSLPEDLKSKNLHELDLDRDKLPLDRALGLQWCIETDTFKFKLKVKEKPPTKRGMLSIISSVYDPLGFLAPLVLPAKLLLQELCRTKCDWDDPIPPAFQQKWKKWLTDLEKVAYFKIHRCVKPEGFGRTVSAQLHHFAEASENGYEVKRNLTVNAILVDTNATSQLMTHFSDWQRLKVAVAWLIKLKGTLLKLSKKRKELKRANTSATGAARLDVQKEMQAFSTSLGNQKVTLEDLLEAETSGKPQVPRSSSILKLDPVLGGGLLRVGGRLNKAAIPEDIQHPLILSKDQHISDLILRHVHLQLGHGGRSHVLSATRRKYWVTSGPTAVRKIISRCLICKLHGGKTGEQKMADLPEERVVSDLPPFTNVGVDYFGPVDVKRGCSIIKRYGVVFTCMTSRAVHLEVAYSLDTDSCINALRRFICRRGQVSHLRSDNGTNFVGAERELREALASLNHDRIERALSKKGIKWSFNPPAGSHHGGAWERMIRMIRKILCSVLRQQTLDDEGFHTVLCEAEAMLNDRPTQGCQRTPTTLRR
ncbi:hypothetical protein N1851_033910 [Merluccius polli]|uniref:Integrase catalytic domain-containing protein n=1 Tax=Merluccius polli TaxID=89951 RepID=A0AA47M0E0_MERPO|nr:hypothetical protein N1851_033910 [Merluccius polli]